MDGRRGEEVFLIERGGREGIINACSDTQWLYFPLFHIQSLRNGPRPRRLLLRCSLCLAMPTCIRARCRVACR